MPTMRCLHSKGTFACFTPPFRPHSDLRMIFNGSYATELLTAAVAHFNLFGRLAQAPRTLQELGADLEPGGSSPLLC